MPHGALRPLDHGNANVAGLPRLDWNPGMELAVVELDLAVVVDDQAAIVGVAARVELHDGEVAADPIVDADLLESRDLRSNRVCCSRSLLGALWRLELPSRRTRTNPAYY